jgi:hypothetical protein
MYLTEDYNSPQSVYWALKSFIVVSVAEKDTFWTEPEAPYPCIGVHDASILAPSPQQILCNHPDGSHHFMLSFSQFIGLPFKGGLAKYCKFAYSSSFGFSVPNGPNSLGQLAPDSALVFSRDGGETWAVKYKSSNARYGKLSVFGTDHLIGSVSWYPWADHSVLVRTTMIPPTSRWPDWHVRIHRIKAGNSTSRLFLAEGGFSINGRQHSNHQELPELAPESLRAPTYVGTAEGVIKTNRSVLIVSDKGASGISTETLSVTVGKTSAVAFKPEPNTNIMEPRTLIPLLEHDIVHGLVEGQDIVIIAKVFAISVRGNCGISKEKLDLTRRWLDEPSIKLGDGDSKTQDQLYVPLHLVT